MACGGEGAAAGSCMGGQLQVAAWGGGGLCLSLTTAHAPRAALSVHAAGTPPTPRSEALSSSSSLSFCLSLPSPLPFPLLRGNHFRFKVQSFKIELKSDLNLDFQPSSKLFPNQFDHLRSRLLLSYLLIHAMKCREVNCGLKTMIPFKPQRQQWEV